MKRIVLTYADYEDADSSRVDEVKGIVAKHGGTVIGERASEEDNEATVVARIPEANIEGLRAEAEEAGWELAIR